MFSGWVWSGQPMLRSSLTFLCFALIAKCQAGRPRPKGQELRGDFGDETRTTFLSIAATYEHIAESVERDAGKERLPNPADRPGQ